MRDKKYFYFLFFILIIVLVPSAARGADSIHRILLIGNSYTYGNDLDKLLEQVARSMGEQVEVRRAAKAGYTLNQHLEDEDTQKLLASRRWDLVVIQEHSMIPAFDKLRRHMMFPAVMEFKRRIQDQGAQPMLMMTWGRREETSSTLNGRRMRISDYDSMQNALRDGYESVATRLDLPVAPVGLAWKEVRKRFPGIKLYTSDGSHPNINGSYLASLVLYGAIFHRSPYAVTYRPSEIEPETARKLRQAANWFLYYAPHGPNMVK